MAALDWGTAGLVLLAAVLHATWNALTKASGDPLLKMMLVLIVSSGIGAVGACLVPPPPREAWPFLAGSIAVHTLYQTLLVQAYRLGDLSHVYPIARGSAPPLVAGLSALLAGELLGPWQTAGLCLACLGIGSIAFGPRASGSANARAVGLAFATGAAIGSYSFIDGMGVRSSGVALSYISWQLLASGLPFVAVAVVLRRRSVMAFLRAEAGEGLVAGTIATVGYAIVMWAMGRGGMAHVSSLRETSVILAALIGTLVLGEPFGRSRVAAATAVTLGITLLQLA